MRGLRAGLWMATLMTGLAFAQARDVRVGVYQNDPKIFFDGNGRASGIMIDLLEAIAREEKWNLQYHPCEWSACLSALEQGRIDLMPDVAYTAERDRLFDFHRVPALQSWSQVYRHRSVPVNSMSDLAGLRVAVLKGSASSKTFAEMSESFGVSPVIVQAGSIDEAFELVRVRKADAAIANHHYGSRNALHNGLQETAIIFQQAYLFYATAQGHNADLLQSIDQALTRWREQADSPYLSIMKRWAAPLPVEVVPRSFWWVLTGVAVSLALALGAALWFRRKVTERTRHLLQAHEEVSRFKFIFDHAGFAAWIADTGGTLVYANARCAELHGTTVGRLIGRRYATLYGPRHQVQALDFWRDVLEGRAGTTAELWHVAADWHEFPMLTSGIVLRDPEGRPTLLACTAIDITDRKQAEARIHQLAYYDVLTGLPNRRLLTDHLQQALSHCARRGTRGGLIFIDLDHFKTINDTLGHDVGDELLREVATRIRVNLRVGDTVARLGGDEFVVLIEELSEAPEMAASQAEGVGQKIAAALNRPYALGGSMQFTTASMGVTLFGQEPVTIEELLKQADLAMYQAKSAGRNSLRFFDPRMQTVVSERAALQADLRDALAGQQFFIEIQPQLAESGRVVGAEVLLRWRHPRRGLVSPVEFIGVAEETGLIHELGQWVLAQACEQLRAWSGDPELARLRLAVNLSAVQFHHPDFVPRVLEVVRLGGIDPRCLKLEITESLLMVDVDDVVCKMGQLRENGIGFSLDDFGTGYSSLIYLKQLPLEQLKIDATFVRDLLTDPNDAAIVRAIITLARSLGLVAIAEGVETPEQKAALVAEGCDAFQGYLFSRPVPPEQFVAFVRQAGAHAPAMG